MSNLEDTNKMSKVTDEMLETFSDKKPEKTVVEFDEDKVEEQVTEEQKEDKPKKKSFFLRGLGITLLIVFVGIVIFGIWNRWFRYNDEEQIVSNWLINNTNAVVVIDKKTINFSPDAVMNYTLDTGAKVINYQIGDFKGQSHYRFSWDMNQLALVENTAYDPISTILCDLGWFWDWSTCGMSKIDLSPAYTKNNKEEVDTEYTGIDDIINNGKTDSILLDRVPTKKTDEA